MLAAVNWNWVAITSGLSAVATVTLAFFTWRMAVKTGDEAEETRKLAQEARTDRELQWRPVLYLAGDMDPLTNPTVTNSGGGPALKVQVFARTTTVLTSYMMFGFGDIRSGESKTQDFSAVSIPGNTFVPEVFDRGPDCNGSENVTVTIFCTDVLGRRLRFTYAEMIGATPHPNGIVFRHRLPVEIEQEPWQHRWSNGAVWM